MTWFGQCRQKGDLQESTCQGGGNWETYEERLVRRGVGLEVRKQIELCVQVGDTTRRLGE